MEQESRPLLAGDFRERVSNEIWTHRLWRAVFAEFLGTLLFVHFECGAILASQKDLIVVAGTLGVTILVLQYMFSEISGGYFNPAVTFAAMLVREINPLCAFLYSIAQLGGAIMGVLILYALVPHSIKDSSAFQMVVTELGTNVTRAEGLFIEVVITFLVVFVYLMVDINQYKRNLRPAAPFIIAGALSSTFLFAGIFTGASLNPARSFGAAAITNYWHNHWIYWVGPLLGASLATLFFKIFETHWHDLERNGELKRDELEAPVSTGIVISSE